MKCVVVAENTLKNFGRTLLPKIFLWLQKNFWYSWLQKFFRGGRGRKKISPGNTVITSDPPLPGRKPWGPGRKPWGLVTSFLKRKLVKHKENTFECQLISKGSLNADNRPPWGIGVRMWQVQPARISEKAIF